MKKNFISIILILLSSSELFCQGWEKVYKDIYLHDISSCGAGIQKSQLTSDGGVIVVGYGYTGTSTIPKSFVIKTNSHGVVSWSKVISDSITLLAECIIETNDGFLIGGSRYNTIAGFLLKVDVAGNMLWTKKYNGSNDIEMILKNGSDFILFGQRNGGIGIYCAKINNNGFVKWAKTLSDVCPEGIAQAENNGLMIVAKKQSYVYGMGDECHIIRLDSLGNTLWAKSYTYANSFDGNVIKLTTAGDYIIGGSILMKINKNGELLWVKNGYFGSSIKDISQTADDGFILAMGGYWNIDGISILKVSSEGIPQWQKVFGDIHDQTCNIFVAPDQGFLITGYHQDMINTNVKGIYLIKTSSNGESGCNSKPATLPSYTPGSSLCIINNILPSSSNNAAYSDIILTINSFTMEVFNPCCFARPEIVSDYYPCSGDSIHYTGYGGPHLQWYNGSTAVSIITKDTVVALTVTNTCGSYSDTLIVHPGFVPTFICNINKDTLCAGDSVLLHIKGNAPYYSCGGNHVKKINDTTYTLKPTETSNYTVYGYTGYRGPGCGSTQTFTIYVSPDKPIISKKNDTLFSSSANNNQWFLNGNIINGATDQTLLINKTGIYSVKVIDGGCSNLSDDFPYVPDTAVYKRNAWQKIIGSDGYAAGSCIVQANDGGLIIGSNYFKYGARDKISLIKTDRKGEVLWSKKYGGSGMDNINSIIKVSNGYIAVGSTTSFGNGNSDVYILSLDEQGQLLWSKTYGDWNDQIGTSIEQTSDGGFIVTGYSTHPNSYSVTTDGWLIDESDIYLLKIDATGNLLWSKLFDASKDERGQEVHQTNDGNYIVAGRSQYRIYFLKTDANGNLLWSKIIPSNYAGAVSMKVTSDNNFIICASAAEGAFLFKFNGNGNILWSKNVNVKSEGKDLVITNDGGAVFTTAFGYGFGQGALTKIDMDGNLVWSTNYNSSIQQYISSLGQLNDGSFVLIGIIDTLNHYGPGQINIINTDIDGQTNCSESFYPSITDASYSYYSHTTVISSLGNEMNASTNFYPGIFQSRTLCKSAALPLDIKKILKYFTLKVYPNPTDGIINVEFPAIQNNCRIRVLDIWGRCIYDQYLNGNSYYEVNLSAKEKGIYFVEITSGDQRTVKKIVLQ